jgi:hypothetical protein
MYLLTLCYIDHSFYSVRYTLASKMEDIHMGDTHLIAINDCGVDDDEPSCDQYVALIVAQHRNKFDFTALDLGKFSVSIKSIRYLSETFIEQLSKVWLKQPNNSKQRFIYRVLVLVLKVNIILSILKFKIFYCYKVSIGMVLKN